MRERNLTQQQSYDLAGEALPRRGFLKKAAAAIALMAPLQGCGSKEQPAEEAKAIMLPLPSIGRSEAAMHLRELLKAIRDLPPDEITNANSDFTDYSPSAVGYKFKTGRMVVTVGHGGETHGLNSSPRDYLIRLTDREYAHQIALFVFPAGSDRFSDNLGLASAMPGDSILRTPEGGALIRDIFLALEKKVKEDAKESGTGTKKKVMRQRG